MRIKLLKEVLPVDGWTEVWPTQPNTLWWFYGHRFVQKDNPEPEPELLLVEVWQFQNCIGYVASGNFFYKSEGAKGVFLRCIPPVPIKG